MSDSSSKDYYLLKGEIVDIRTEITTNNLIIVKLCIKYEGIMLWTVALWPQQVLAIETACRKFGNLIGTTVDTIINGQKVVAIGYEGLFVNDMDYGKNMPSFNALYNTLCVTDFKGVLEVARESDTNATVIDYYTNRKVVDMPYYRETPLLILPSKITSFKMQNNQYYVEFNNERFYHVLTKKQFRTLQKKDRTQ